MLDDMLDVVDMEKRLKRSKGGRSRRRTSGGETQIGGFDLISRGGGGTANPKLERFGTLLGASVYFTLTRLQGRLTTARELKKERRRSPRGGRARRRRRRGAPGGGVSGVRRGSRELGNGGGVA
jgi:hypothetical protein